MRALVSPSFMFALLLSLSFIPVNVFAASVKLSWDLPTVDIEGAPIAGLSGVIVSVGESSGSYVREISIGPVAETVVTDLTPGTTYFFAVQAVSIEGLSSDYSNEATHTVAQPGEPPGRGVHIGTGKKPSIAPQNDDDSDGIDAIQDNCDNAANESQIDTDSDGIGDDCDPAPDTAAKRIKGDYDGDEISDFVTARTSRSTFSFSIQNSASNVSTTRTFGKKGDEFAAGDYNGDGRYDLGVARRQKGKITWSSIDAVTGTPIATRRLGGPDSTTLSGCYADADDITDPVTIEPSGRIKFYSSLFGRTQSFLAPRSTARESFCADIDGDGVDEIIMQSKIAAAKGKPRDYLLGFNTSGGQVYAQLISPKSRILAADFNQDGISDPAAYRLGKSGAEVDFFVGLEHLKLGLTLPQFSALTPATLVANNSSKSDGFFLIVKGPKQSSINLRDQIVASGAALSRSERLVRSVSMQAAPSPAIRK